MKLWISTIIAMAIVARVADAQVVQVIEAEACDARQADGRPATVLDDAILASGGKRIGNFWGERAGDEIRFDVDLKGLEMRLKLAVRYSYHHTHYQQMRGPTSAERKLTLLIDGEEAGEVAIADTANWHDFQSAYVELPKLSRGRHTFTLRADAARLTTDLDAFTLFRGDPEKVLTPAWRSSVVIRSPDGRFTVRMTAKCVVKHTPEQIVRNFDRIYDFFEDYMGWAPDRGVINIHVYEDALARGTFENQHGIYFEASNFNWDRGNWIHEMNHVFDNGLFPDWTGHPMIRVNDTFVTGPGCFPELWGGPQSDPQWKIRLEAGRRVLDDPDYRTDDPHEILYALNAKYGRELLRRFYKECREAKRRDEIKLVRGHVMTRDEYVRLMSRAAGEDVRRYFEQWKGFDKAK